VARWVLTGRLTRRTAFDLPLALFLGTAGLAVWSAFDREAAWAKFWLIVGAVLLFYAFVNAETLAGGEGTGDPRGWLLAFFGAGVGLYFLALHNWDELPGKIEALTRLGRALQAPLPTLPGHRLHPNVVGGIVATMLPFAAWATLDAWQARDARRHPWLAIAAGLTLTGIIGFALVMTTARAAWLATAAAGILAALYALATWLARGRPERRARILPALLAAASVVLLAIGIGWSGALTAALDALPGDATWVSRAALVRNARPLVGDYAFVGAGLGNFQMLYSTYAILLHVGVIYHSHNLYLNVAIEQGLPALLILASTWLLFGIAVARRILLPPSTHSTGSTHAARLGVLGPATLSLTITIIHGLADDVLYGSRAVLLLFIPLAFAVPVLARKPARMRRGALLLPVTILLLLAAAVVWRRPLLSSLHANLGAVAQSRTELSIYAWPEWPLQEAVRREADLGRAIAHFERALDLNPANATANRRLGMIELARADYEPALAHLQAAHAAEPASPVTRQLLGEALVVTGHIGEGQALWHSVDTAHEGWLQARLFWYRHIGDTQRHTWMQQAAEDR
jgi:hypothetical protein